VYHGTSPVVAKEIPQYQKQGTRDTDMKLLEHPHVILLSHPSLLTFVNMLFVTIVDSRKQSSPHVIQHCIQLLGFMLLYDIQETVNPSQETFLPNCMQVTSNAFDKFNDQAQNVFFVHVAVRKQ
jgi:hypothetical protein